MPNYCAIICDMIDSKNIKNRLDVQSQLFDTLEIINQKYNSHIVSKFTVTLGDEFQGLVKVSEDLVKILDDLQRLMHPYPIRTGLGFGEITTKINPNQSIGADGPAYWRAREAIDYVHRYHDYETTHTYILVGSKEHDNLLNALLSAGDFIKKNWLKSQIETFHFLLDQGVYASDFDQKTLAEKMGISQSAFTKRLKSSGIKIYFRTRLAFSSHLISLDHKEESDG